MNFKPTEGVSCWLTEFEAEFAKESLCLAVMVWQLCWNTYFSLCNGNHILQLKINIYSRKLRLENRSF